MTRAMAQADGPASSAPSLSYRLLHAAAQVKAALTEWRQMRKRRRALSDLTQDQLRDVGVDEIPRAVLIAEARLMADLISMR
jgi:uncharacterized protein YjiS (DUF1127 family)